MSEKKNTAGAANEEQMGMAIVAQYIKDLSFEKLNSLSQEEAAKQAPQVEVSMKVEANKKMDPGLPSDIYAVSLIINIDVNHAKAKKLFLLELNYTGEFELRGISGEMLNPILYIECPRILFPFARSIIASTMSESGFPLYLAPVNFLEMYQQQAQQQAQANENNKTLQ